jgi:thiamine-monophosphate kinase
MMDVSDGLLLDAARLAAASGVGIELLRSGVPVSSFYRSRRGGDLDLALRGGEDYVLLFTAPPDDAPPLAAWRVGHCTPGAGLRLDGEPARPRGYDHFA